MFASNDLQALGVYEAARSLGVRVPEQLVPSDVARMLLWLAADDSSACTAQRRVVDGGWM